MVKVFCFILPIIRKGITPATVVNSTPKAMTIPKEEAIDNKDAKIPANAKFTRFATLLQLKGAEEIDA